MVLLVSVVIGCVLLRRLWAIRPLYLSGQVRGDAAVIMNMLRDRDGVARSFFVLRSVQCREAICELVMKEQWNLVTAHAPLQVLHASWTLGAPDAFTWAYATN